MTDAPVRRRLAAIVVADVVGYSRMMGVDEAGTLATLSERRKRILEPVIRAHEGRIVKVMGDGVLVEFASAVNAVQAALDLQEKMSAANTDVPEGRKIVLRIGINLGEVIVKGSDVYGEGVNVAARLESIAPAGGIAISGNAYDQVRNRIAASFDDLGLQALKNIQEPVRVYRVSPALANPAAQIGKPDTRPSMAILPFANLNDDPDQGYFSDGITEDIITELSRWRLLSVRSRSASFRYRGIAVDMKQVARELDVRFIVEGSVRRIGDRIRITAQLIDGDTGSHVWAEKFDRDVVDIFAVQDQVVRTIVSTLVGRVQASDVARARRKPPASLAAYECVLKGNALPWADPDGAAEAMRLFERAIELDPGYGLAHALVAAMWADRWYDDVGDPEAALERALVLANRSVELDENESTCFSMLGHIQLKRRAFDQALQCVQRAVELNPNNQWNAADLGAVLVYIGQAEQALVWFARAHEIDPYFDPPWYSRSMGQAYMVLRRYPEALLQFDHLPAGKPRFAAYKAACHARLGDVARASACVAECLSAKPGFSVRQFMTKEPFRDPADAAHLVEGLRMAGLPD